MTFVEHPADLILGPAEEPLIRAMSDVEGEGMLALPSQLIVANWDPHQVQERNLAYLRWALGVVLWDEAWDDTKKRQWMADQWLFKARRGTKAGIRMALEMFDYSLGQVVAPPQSFFLSPDLSKEEYDLWIRQMPELRFYFGNKRGTAGENEIIVGEEDERIASFLDEDAIAVDDGPLLYGRYAVLRLKNRDGTTTDVPLDGGEVLYGEELGSMHVVQRVTTPGHNEVSAFLDADDPTATADLSGAFLDVDYLDTTEDEPVLYTVELDQSYSHLTSALSLTTVTSSLTPISPRFERDSDIGTAGPFFYLDDGFIEEDFLEEEKGDLMLAERVYLLDPKVSVPMTLGWSFIDVDRLSMPTYYAELMIDLNLLEKRPALFVEVDGGIGEAFLGDETATDGHIDRALTAVTHAKALRDTVMAQFDPWRRLQFGDLKGPDFTEQTRFGTHVQNRL